MFLQDLRQRLDIDERRDVRDPVLALRTAVDAAMIGSAAFLAPLIDTSPSSFLPPLMTIDFIFIVNHGSR